MARPLSIVVTKGWTSGVQAISGAAPKTVNSKTFDTRLAAKGSLAAHIDYNCLTNTITFTATWQISTDGTNWYPVRPSNAAADVAFVTGTGVQITTSIVLNAPDSVYAYPYVRLLVTSGTGAGQGAAKDDCTFFFSYVKSQLGS